MIGIAIPGQAALMASYMAPAHTIPQILFLTNDEKYKTLGTYLTKYPLSN